MPASNVGDSRGTAGVEPEEGGDDVKSSCPLCPGLHTCYNAGHNGLRPRERSGFSPRAEPPPDTGEPVALRAAFGNVVFGTPLPNEGEASLGPYERRSVLFGT